MIAMLRRLLVSLSCISFATLSCGHFKRPLPPELPAVSLARPEPAERASAPDAAVESAIRYLDARKTGLSSEEVARVAQAIVSEARQRAIDPNLVMAVIHVESRGNAFALSPVGAMGMMQIMPPTGEELAAKLDIPWFGEQTLFDPLVNVRMGIAYLEELHLRYGDTATALAAYNWGPGRIDSRIERGDALPAIYTGSVLAAYRAH